MYSFLRANERVRVGNTDAEGRMAMLDSLCEAKEICLETKPVNPHLFTIATLTGHVIQSYGFSYSVSRYFNELN
jgi:leucyl aminopeptidase